MMKYVISVLIFVVTIIGLLFYVGETSHLNISSISPHSGLNFDGQLSWRIVIIAGTVGLILSLLLWSILNWLLKLPARLKSGADQRKRSQLLGYIEDALTYGSAENIEKSRKKSGQIRAVLQDKPLSHIISASASEAAGDHEEAIVHYSSLLNKKATRELGQRGLTRIFQTTGNLQGLIDQAGEAYRQGRSSQWAFSPLFEAQVTSYYWTEAAHTLQQAVKRGHVDKAIANRRRAVLLTAHADRLFAAGETAQAQAFASEAAALMPSFIPASLCAAKLLTDARKPKKAAKLLEKAWADMPHPSLVFALRAIYTDHDGLQTHSDTYNKALKSLIKTNPDHRESHILSAEEHLRRNEPGEALAALSTLIDAEGDAISARLCALIASIETAQGHEAKAYQWLERSVTAPLEPEWRDQIPCASTLSYSDAEWAELVFSYGDHGKLIYPRYSAGAPARHVLTYPTASLINTDTSDTSNLDPAEEDPVVVAPEEDEPVTDIPPVDPDDNTPTEAENTDDAADTSSEILADIRPNAHVNPENDVDTDDLSERLDNLLDPQKDDESINDLDETVPEANANTDFSTTPSPHTENMVAETAYDLDNAVADTDVLDEIVSDSSAQQQMSSEPETATEKMSRRFRFITRPDKKTPGPYKP